MSTDSQSSLHEVHYEVTVGTPKILTPPFFFGISTRQMHKFRGSGAEVPVNPAQEACRARFEKFTKCEHGRMPKNRTSTQQLQRCGAMRASRYARSG